MNTRTRFRGDGDDSRFAKWLSDLKQSGSNILITGAVPDAVSARASRHFFGREERRFRILGLTDQTITSGGARLPDDASFDDPTSWIIDQRRGERSVPVTANCVTSDLNPPETDDAQQLCDEVQTAISFYEKQASGLDPAELRVGIDSLFPLVQEDLSTTEHTLRTLGATVRGVQGMAHYHLRVHDDDEIVDELMPLFDARVELRKLSRRNPEQRWHAPEIDAKTMWMRL